MLIIRYNIFHIRSYRAVNEFIIIRVSREQFEMYIRILKSSSGNIRYCFYNIPSYLGS